MNERTESSRAPEPTEFLDVEGQAGEAITLPIASGPATGYTWYLELPEGVQRIDDGPARPLEPSVRSGGAAGGYLRVTAPIGEHTIIAQLARPWEQNQPVRVVQIRLHIT